MSVKVGEPLKWPGFLTSDTGSKLGLGTEGTIRMEMPNTHGGETGRLLSLWDAGPFLLLI